MPCWIVDGLAGLLGVSPLSPSGALEKRSSTWKPLNESCALGLFLRLCPRHLLPPSKCRPLLLFAVLCVLFEDLPAILFSVLWTF
ncbi:hypothetical protein NPIL_334801 [Nephila pilipes]|uniref:Uncharacterized protein n=1 Tax=Nephila pilipes TaxID=299642 RepID=A0A8X6PCF9_NEPPI|nr:hypothetical protein NPIL_334801 [Nephila pilipes]